MAKCILCGAKATNNVQDNASRTIYNCQNCGVFVVSDLTIKEVRQNAPRLAGYFANRKLVGNNEVVLITFDKAKKDKSYLQLTVDQILKRYPHTFTERMDMALMNLSMMSGFEGDEVKIEDESIGPVFCLEQLGSDALCFAIKSLQKMGYIDVNFYHSTFFPCGIVVSAEGWERVEKLRSGKATGDKALVLSFGEAQDSTTQIFRDTADKAALDCGYHVVDNHCICASQKINFEIVARIKESRFIISDLTDAKGPVYYAAGMADAMGKTQILTCHTSKIKQLEIDTEQFRVLTWSEEQDLYSKVFNAIQALLG